GNRSRRAHPTLTEEPLLLEPLLELLEGERQRALPHRLDALDDQAVAALRGPHVDRALHQDREPFAKAEAQALRHRGPDLHLNRCVRILEAEEEVAPGMRAAVPRDLPADPDALEPGLEGALDGPRELTDAQDLPLWRGRCGRRRGGVRPRSRPGGRFRRRIEEPRLQGRAAAGAQRSAHPPRLLRSRLALVCVSSPEGAISRTCRIFSRAPSGLLSLRM